MGDSAMNKNVFEQQIPPDSKFGHEGELEMRKRLPSPIYQWDKYSLSGMIQEAIAPGMARFIEAQRFFFMATSDTHGRCDIGFRGAGVDHNEDNLLPPCLILEQGRVMVIPNYEDNMEEVSLKNIATNPHIGLIFIDFTRIGRVRVNGIACLTNASDEIKNIWPEAKTCIQVFIEQAYGNCPARIPRLHFVDKFGRCPPETEDLNDPNGSTGERMYDAIPPDVASTIETKPFFFIGTADNEGHCDASFRGTESSLTNDTMLLCCHVINEGKTLIFPDYSGNALYNSLGNILLNPHIGIVFVDFTQANSVRVSGKVTLEQPSDDTKRMWPHAQAHLRVTVEKVNITTLKRMPELAP